MKRRTPTSLLLALALLPLSASAQLWIENLTDTNLTFAFRGVTGLGVYANENQGAGARLSLNFDTTTRVLGIDVTNLSGGVRTVGTGAAQQNVFFGAGTLMGFGFETNPDNLLATWFGAWTNTAFNAPGTFGGDAINFNLTQDYNLSGGTGSPFYMDVGTATGGNVNGGNPSAGLSAGHGASFRFRFNSAAFDATTFNPFDFFFRDTDPDIYDMSFRFQQTSGLGQYDSARRSDSFGHSFAQCDNDGSDKVAIVFNTEYDYEVPEPSTYGLIGAGALLALALHRRFRRR